MNWQDVPIFVLTRNRPHFRPTDWCLASVPRTYLIQDVPGVVYRFNVASPKILTCPGTLGDVMSLVTGDYALFLHDDLFIHKRYSFSDFNRWQEWRNTPEVWLQQIADQLDHYALVSMCSVDEKRRSGNDPHEGMSCEKVLGIDLAAMRAERIKFSGHDADLHATIAMMKAGYPAITITDFGYEHRRLSANMNPSTRLLKNVDWKKLYEEIP